MLAKMTGTGDVDTDWRRTVRSLSLQFPSLRTLLFVLVDHLTDILRYVIVCPQNISSLSEVNEHPQNVSVKFVMFLAL